jgi:hypothetical protein
MIGGFCMRYSLVLVPLITLFSVNSFCDELQPKDAIEQDVVVSDVVQQDVVQQPSLTVPPQIGQQVQIPQKIEDFVPVIMQIISAAKSGHWLLFTGLILMFVVYVFLYVFNKFLPGFFSGSRTKYVPWITLALSFIFVFGFLLSQGTVVWQALVYALISSLTAVGSWETFFKHILPKQTV